MRLTSKFWCHIKKIACVGMNAPMKLAVCIAIKIIVTCGYNHMFLRFPKDMESATATFQIMKPERVKSERDLVGSMRWRAHCLYFWDCLFTLSLWLMGIARIELYNCKIIHFPSKWLESLIFVITVTHIQKHSKCNLNLTLRESNSTHERV